MSDNPLKELQDLHRVWEFKNKTNSVQPIELADGDSVKVQPRGTLRLQSAKFHQLPAISTFTYLKPTLDDLRAVGLLNTEAPKSEAAPTSSEVE
jgi:hypothetical protein